MRGKPLVGAMVYALPAELDDLAAGAGEGIRGTAAVSNSMAAAIEQMRSRARNASDGARMERNANHPPAKPPSVAKTGGIQAKCSLAWTSLK